MLEDEHISIDMSHYVHHASKSDDLHEGGHACSYSSKVRANNLKSRLRTCGATCCWLGYSVAVFPDLAYTIGWLINYERSSERMFGISLYDDREAWVFLFGAINPNSAASCAIRLLMFMQSNDALIKSWHKMSSEDHNKTIEEFTRQIGLTLSFTRESEAVQRKALLPILKEKLQSYENN